MNVVKLVQGAVVSVDPVDNDAMVVLTEKSPRISSIRVGLDVFVAPTDAVQVRSDGTIEAVMANTWADEQSGDGWRSVPTGTVTADMVWDGTTFALPKPAEPTAEEIRAAMPELNTVQMEAMLQISGKRDAVYAAINAIADETQRIIAKAYLERSVRYRRTFPLTEQIRAVIGLTPEELDVLWMQAAAI